MHRCKLAYHGAVAYLDIRHRSFLVLEILGLHSDQGIREYLALLTDSGMSIDYGTLSNSRTRAELDISPDGRVRTDLDALAQLSSLIHHRGGMHFYSHETVLLH